MFWLDTKLYMSFTKIFQNLNYSFQTVKIINGNSNSIYNLSRMRLELLTIVKIFYISEWKELQGSWCKREDILEKNESNCLFAKTSDTFPSSLNKLNSMSS